ncbi:MAG: hypothetical protein M1839_007133 [Geoglossum umbratile]|nr:MAG: hypothetical protein M1839_007133 [Geoglossum umbratile]
MYHSIPLDSDKGEIRLLRVLPGEFFSKIKCELFKVSLDDKPDYKALSYVWGDSADRENIVVNGHDVAVTVNLGQSLRRLRSHSAGQPLTLWADAVCINQENLDELGAQVSIMGRIYSSCSGVCIWLGPCGSENVTQCLDFNLPPSATSPGDTTPSLSTQFSEYAESHSDDIVSGLARCAHALVRFAFGAHLREVEPFAAGSESSYHPMLDAMKNLASSPWFGRAWIVQEARLAPSATVYIGNVALAGKVLWHAYKNRKKLAATCPDCRGGPETAPFLDAMNGFIGDLVRLALKDPDGTEMSQVSVPGLFLLQFSLLHRHQECCRDVDRIYAYVGIVENLSGVKSLKPDYHLTAPQLYLRVCADAVVSGRTLTFLAWNTAKNRYSELPSWVVDWTNTVSTEELTHMFISKCWAAATELEFRVRIDNDKILVTKGLEIDRVSDIGSVWRNENQSILDPTLWAQWHQVAGLHDNPDRLYPSGGTYRDAWWKALCFDSTNAEYKRSNYEMRAFELVSTILPHSYINFDSNLSQECQDLGFALSVESLDNLFKFTTREIWGTLPHMLNNCRLFATQKGRLGFSRDALQVGDPIFLLPNCPAPLILRQTGDTFVGGGEFEGESLNGHPLHVLISDAYIYGIMDGEAVQAMGSSLSKIVCVK